MRCRLHSRQKEKLHGSQKLLKRSILFLALVKGSRVLCMVPLTAVPIEFSFLGSRASGPFSSCCLQHSPPGLSGPQVYLCPGVPSSERPVSHRHPTPWLSDLLDFRLFSLFPSIHLTDQGILADTLPSVFDGMPMCSR